MSIIQARKSYINAVDAKAKEIAEKRHNKKSITNDILNFIKELYSAAKIEIENQQELPNFSQAYHNPITSDLEFFIARIIFHYGILYGANWEISVRRQKGKCAPDIRVHCGEETLSIIEIKAKAGWIQSFFSPKEYDRCIEKLKEGSSKFNPNELIASQKNTIEKYKNTFKIKQENIHYLLPSMAMVHRKKSELKVEDYRKHFEEKSNLSKNNLILLSENLNLDLSSENNEELKASRDMENYLDSLLDSWNKSKPDQV